MLTQDQLEQLKPLTEHPKYGKILSDAIEVWKQKDITPFSGLYGIIENEDNSTFIFNEAYNKKCCLLGASLLNKKIKKIDNGFSSMVNSVSQEFNINVSEASDMVYGFDQFKKITSFEKRNTEACNFAEKIGEIVLSSKFFESLNLNNNPKSSCLT